MKVLDDYMQEVRRLFFISVDTTPENWKINGTNKYELKYGSWSDDKLIIDLNKHILYVGDFSDPKKYVIISKYKNIFVTDMEIYNSVKKLKLYFKTEDENKKNQEKIVILKDGFNQLIKNYQKEYDKKLRKDKLDNIENN